MPDRLGTPPRLAHRLLDRVLPRTPAGRSALGDILEEYHRRPRGLRRDGWFWLTTFDVGLHLAFPWRSAGSGPARDGRPRRWFSGVRNDLVFAIRLARRQPSLVFAALTSMTLAIGVTTAAVSVTNGVWFREFLAANPAVVHVWRDHARGSSLLWPASEAAELRRQAASISLATWSKSSLSLRVPGGSDADSVQTAFVTGGYFAMLGERPSFGRLLDTGDDRPAAAAVAVLDHLFWRRQFHADPGIVGRTIQVGGVAATVIGVARRDFVDLAAAPVDVWLSAPTHDHFAAAVPAGPERVRLTGRLRAGVSEDQAIAELTGLLTGRVPLEPGERPVTGVQFMPLMSREWAATLRLILAGVLAIVALVLVLACANVSNLQLAGAIARRREMAVRLSLGASRGRIWRQLLTESALLCAVGGAGGWFVAHWLSPLLAASLGMSRIDIDPDQRVFAFVVASTVIATFASGLVPAYHASRRNVVAGLAAGSTGAVGPTGPGRARSLLIAIQSACSIVLVVAAALFVRSLVHLSWLDPGFDVDRLAAVYVSLPRNARVELQPRVFWTTALARVRDLPGVSNASLATFPPFGRGVSDFDDDQTNATDAAYFATAGIRLLRGRAYTDAEVSTRAPVAVISEGLAREFWGEEDPLGDTLERVSSRAKAISVIGIAADAMTTRVHERRTPVWYAPITLDASALTSMVVRAEDPRAIATALQDAIGALDPDVRPRITILADRFEAYFQAPRRFAAIGAAVAVFTLILSMVGIAGVTAFLVRGRTREIGIRMALGARPADIVSRFAWEGMRPVAAGLAIGLVGALLFGRVIAGMLSGLSARDPLAIAVAVAVLAGAALAAILIPTRRATRLNPAVVLRES